MADKPGSSKDAAGKTSETSEYDPSLDFYSDKFDPLKALECANIKVPVPDAKMFDNLAMYESTQRRLTSETHDSHNVKVSQRDAPNLKFERKFEPHQMPIQGGRKERVGRNIFTEMEKFDGPLSLLKLCVDNRTRIKVWTRHSHGIRGYCLAFCVAFDKHWNLALEDVTETWTRKRSRKVPALGSLEISEQVNTKPRKVQPAKVTIKKTTRKQEFCERYVPQLIVRGEQVAFINLVKYE